jgi:hypothetical protein
MGREDEEEEEGGEVVDEEGTALRERTLRNFNAFERVPMEW